MIVSSWWIVDGLVWPNGQRMPRRKGRIAILHAKRLKRAARGK